LTLIDHLGTSGTDADRPSVTIPLAGEFDLTRETELLHTVIQLDLPTSTVVRLEMSRVTSADFGGLRGILAARAYLKSRGCELELLHPNGQIQQVLDITGLGEVLTIDNEQP
jgi:anti-anti-sigma factor